MSIPTPRLLLAVVALGIAAVVAWAFDSDGRVEGTPFYTCVHGCTRYLALETCEATPPTHDYIAGDGCGLGSGVVVWIDECVEGLTVYSSDAGYEVRPGAFEYEVTTGGRYREAVLENASCVREVAAK